VKKKKPSGREREKEKIRVSREMYRKNKKANFSRAT